MKNSSTSAAKKFFLLDRQRVWRRWKKGLSLDFDEKELSGLVQEARLKGLFSRKTRSRDIQFRLLNLIRRL